MLHTPSPSLQAGIRQRSLTRHCRFGRATELIFILATGVTVVLGGQVRGQDVTWTGAGVNDAWEAPDNWDGSATPVGTSDVTIDTNPITILSTAATVNSTTISDTGELQIIGAGASLTSNATVTGGTLQVGGPGGGTLSGSVDLDGGDLRLQGIGTITGNITVTDGTANLAGTVIGAASIDGGTFIANASGFTLSGLATISGGTLNNNGGALNGGVSLSSGTLNNAGNVTGAINVSGGTMNLNTGSNVSDAAALTVNGGTVNVNVAETIGTFSGTGGTINFGSAGRLITTVIDAETFAGNMTGSATAGQSYFIKEGSGTLTLSGTNTVNSGRIDILRGTLQVSGGNAIGDNTVVRFNETTLVLLDNETVGLLAASSGSTVDINGNTLTIAGLGSAMAAEFGGTIIGTGNLTYNAPSLDTIFSGALDHTGTTTISAGTIRVGVSDLFADASTLVVNGGTLNMLASDDTVRAVTLSSGSIIGTGTLTSMSTFDVQSGTVSAGLGGEVGLNKTGAGTVTLSGANTYTGNTNINAGVLRVATGGTLGTAAGTVTVSDGAALELENAVTPANPMVIAGAGTGAGAIVGVGANSSLNGAVTLAADATIGANAGNILNIDGTVSGTTANLTFTGAGTRLVTGNLNFGSGSLINSAGTTQLNGTGTYTGMTVIDSGSLLLNSGSAIIDSGAVVVNAGLFAVGITETVGSIAGAGNVAINSEQELRTGGNNTDTTVSGSISGAGALLKQGTGTLTLSGANTYTGVTTVTAGTLAAGSNSAFGTGRVDLAGGTLLGQGNRVLGNSFSTIFETDSTVAATTGDRLELGTVSPVGAGSILRFGRVGDTGTVVVNNGGAINSSVQIVVEAGTLELGFGSASSRLLSFAPSTTVNAGATLDIAGGDTEVRRLLGTGTVTNSGTADRLLLIGSSTFNTESSTFGGVISDGGTNTTGLSILENYALTLTGNNTYSGTTTISTGALQVGDGSTTGTLGSGAVVNNASLVFNRSNALTVSNAISGTGGLMQAGNGTTTLTGANTFSGTTMINSGILQVGAGGTTGTLGSGAVVNNAELVFNRSDALTVSNVISGSGGLTQAGGGTTTLTGANTYSGPTTVQLGTLALDGGAAINDTGVVTVELDAILRILDSERIGTLTNRGTVSLSEDIGTVGTILTVAGNYGAASDLILDVVLGDDGSASDRLVVEGGTTGTTNVFVINRGGTGARTTTGIMIVDVQGSSAGDFVLANGDVALSAGETGLSAGNYVYVLRNVGGDWYLQSQLQPATVVLEALPAALISQTRAQSLVQRLGGRQVMIPTDAIAVTRGAGGMTTPQPGVWLAMQGTQAEMTPDVSSTGLTYEQSSWRLQTGVDIGLYDNAAGALTGGFSVFAGGGSLDAASSLGAGTISSDMRGIGLHATWLGKGGLYTDLQMEYGLHETDVVADGSGPLIAGLEGIGRMASVEIGQKFVQDSGLIWTPQAQLSWSDIRIDSFTAESGADIDVEDSESLRLRLGLAGEKAWSTGLGPESRLYGFANLIHEFEGGSRVLVDDTALEATTAGWTAEVGIGGTYTWGDDAQPSSIFGEVTTSRAVSGGEMTGLSGSLGLRVSW